MIVGVGGDHAGVLLKESLVRWLDDAGHAVIDHGTFDEQPVDFPDIAALICTSVLDGRVARGLLVCGTGVGASIAANKIAGIRAAVGHDVYSAHQAVEHDDVNVLCLGADIVGPRLATELVATFLTARFDGSVDFTRRVAKLAAMDRR